MMKVYEIVKTTANPNKSGPPARDCQVIGEAIEFSNGRVAAQRTHLENITMHFDSMDAIEEFFDVGHGNGFISSTKIELALVWSDDLRDAVDTAVQLRDVLNRLRHILTPEDIVRFDAESVS